MMLAILDYVAEVACLLYETANEFVFVVFLSFLALRRCLSHMTFLLTW